MIGCGKCGDLLHAYIDAELDTQEQLAVEEHLLSCVTCRREYEEVREVVDVVRGAKPLYSPTPVLSRKLETMLARDYYARVRARAALIAVAIAAAILVVAVLPTFRPPRFTAFAAETHSRYANGSLPLGVSSAEPAIVSGWLDSHLPFHLALPNYPSQFGEPKTYSLVGARVMQYKGQKIAYLAYTMNAHPISLLVTSSAPAMPTDGEVFQSGRLMFHFSSEKGLKLITWRDRDLSYALVSDLGVQGGQSCVVCHGSESERRKFDNLLRLN